jgi:hypothetical protein
LVAIDFFSKVVPWLLQRGGFRKSQPSPENTSPRTTVKAELHMSPCHVDGQEVLAACVIAVQEDSILRVWPKGDLKLSERKVMLRLQGPGRGSVGPQRRAEARNGQGEG